MMYLTVVAFYGIPIAVVVTLVVLLYRHAVRKLENKRKPGSFSEAEMRKRKIELLLTAVVAGILAAVVAVFAVMFFASIAYM